jgi:predicted nucleic acid-binding Zn ribbon protein
MKQEGGDRPLPKGWRPLRREKREPRRVGESIERLAGRLGAPSVPALKVVFGHWAEVVGPAIAEHATPVSLTDGVLVVMVDEPGWATQLKFLTPEVIRNLEAQIGSGAIERVEVRVRGARRGR